MVATDRTSSASSPPSSLACSLCCSRSADSWIGVSGFLISCARRRATSLHAAERCADTTSVMSSKTINRASLGKRGAAHQQHLGVALAGVQLEGFLPVVALAVLGAGGMQLEALPHALRKFAQLGHLVQPLPAVHRQRHAQDARGTRVDGVDVAFAVEHHHAGGQVVQDGLQPRARAFQLRHAALHRLARVGQLRRHVGEGPCQPAQLVARGEHRLAAQVAGGHLAHAVGQQRAAGAPAGCPAAPPAAPRQTPTAPAPASACRCTCGAARCAPARAAGIRCRPSAPPAHRRPAAAAPAAPPAGSAPRRA